MIPFVVKSKLDNLGPLSRMLGWGNGYVLISDKHKLYGKNIEELDKILEVHGGITWSSSSDDFDLPKDVKNNMTFEKGWVIGFDTAHLFDLGKDGWSKKQVMAEAVKLKDQLKDIQDEWINQIQMIKDCHSKIKK